MKIIRESVDMGYVGIPKQYFVYDKQTKILICNEIIDRILIQIDKELDPTINRIQFLDAMMESSIETNLEDENYEVVQVFSDVRKILNES
jgi:predicted secreted protein